MCIYQWAWWEAWSEQEENLTLKSIKAFPAVLTHGTSPVIQKSGDSSYLDRIVGTAWPSALKRKKIKLQSYIP